LISTEHHSDAYELDRSAAHNSATALLVHEAIGASEFHHMKENNDL
jgi:hypothetical protein